MPHHDAYGLSVCDLDVAIVENSRAMQTTLRSMLSTFGVRRTRAYDTGPEALTAMLADPPSVVIAAWQMTPMDGARLIRTLRDPEFPSLCRIPVITATAHATLSVIDAAFSAGCNALLAKPLSSQVLQSRLEWLVRDASQMEERDGRIVVSGIENILESRVRNSPLATAFARATALEAVMRGEEAESEEQQAESMDTPAPAPERPELAGSSAAPVKGAPRKKRARNWHGWDISVRKGSTAA